VKSSVIVNVRGNLYVVYFRIDLAQQKKACIMCGSICDKKSFIPCVKFEEIVNARSKKSLNREDIRKEVINVANDKIKQEMGITTLKKGFPFECNLCSINSHKY
jgi:hypothetical protein